MVNLKRKRSRKHHILLKKQRRIFSSRLMGLPAELRNKIYELVLTAPDGLRIWSAPNSSGRSRSRPKPRLVEHCNQDHDFNQLKFVSRQIYKECAGLEVKFKNITFDHIRPQASMHRFLKFANQCTNARRNWPTHITIKEKVSKKDGDITLWLSHNMTIIIDLLELCIANPSLNVSVEVPGWAYDVGRDDLSAYRLLMGSVPLETMFRAKNLAGMVPESGDCTFFYYDEWVTKLSGKHKATVKALGPRAPNLRFCPAPGELDEILFREKAIASWHEVADDPHILPHDAVDRWVECVRFWLSNGV
jgi:hypothetical protein